jgi:hypothetical protein
MDEGVALETILLALERCGVSTEIRNLADDDIRIESGICEMGGRKILIIDERLNERGRVSAALSALKGQNLDGIFVPPAIRELLNDAF